MSRHPLIKGLALLLVFSFLIPAAFFVAPTPVRAEGGSCIGSLVGGIIGAIFGGDVPTGDKTNAALNGTTAGASVADCIYQVVVIPALRQMIRNMLQKATQATIDWINGKGTNTSGQPSFVQDLAGHLQRTGDTVALSFISQLQKGVLNSPYGPVVALALNKNYLQQTSLAGFLYGNQCTLKQFSSNPTAFANGDFNKGGVQAWLALTTMPQNNPYMLYQAAAGQLASNVTQIQTNRRQDLLQSGGILSFCPPDTSSKISVATSTGILNPQIACTNSDGTPAKSVTPGSAISSYLNTNLGSGIGQLVSAQDLDAAIGQVVQALANNLLGGTGIFGASQPSGTTGPRVIGPISNAATQASGLGDTILANVAAYTTAWQSIGTAATTASTSVSNLITYCNSQRGAQDTSTAYIDTAIAAGQAALSTIASVSTQSQKVSASLASTTALANKVKAEAAVNPIDDPVQFSLDSATLAQMPPSALDVSSAQSAASVGSGARANSTCSLTVNGVSLPQPLGSRGEVNQFCSLTVNSGSLVDQMNLIAANAQTLQTKCGPQPIIPGGGGSGQ